MFLEIKENEIKNKNDLIIVSTLTSSLRTGRVVAASLDILLANSISVTKKGHKLLQSSLMLHIPANISILSLKVFLRTSFATFLL